MKPSHGLVSGEGIVPLIRFQDSAGPIARSVTDAAILLGAIDETETDYAASLDPKALEGIAVGVLRKAILDEETNAAFWLNRIDEGLARAGAKTKDLDETFADKPELLPVIFLGLSCDTLPYLAAAGAPVKSVSDLQAYNEADPERRIPRGQNMVDLSVRVLGAIRDETGMTAPSGFCSAGDATSAFIRPRFRASCKASRSRPVFRAWSRKTVVAIIFETDATRNGWLTSKGLEPAAL